RDGDRERDGHETRADTGIHPRREHVVGPDAKGEHSDGEGGVDDELIPEQLSAGEFRDDETQQPHRWQGENIDFWMAEEPKQVLPEDRPTGRKERGAEVAV